MVALIRPRNFDLQRVYKWRISFPPEIDLQPVDAESTDLPLAEYGKESWTRNGQTIYFAIRPVDIGEVTISLYENNSGQILRALEAWKKLIRNRDGTYNYSRRYKKDILVQMLDFGNNVHTTFQVVRAWPGTTQPVRLSYAENNKLVITQSFVCDEVIVK